MLPDFTLCEKNKKHEEYSPLGFNIMYRNPWFYGCPTISVQDAKYPEFSPVIKI
jgi:hypothetical protein